MLPVAAVWRTSRTAGPGRAIKWQLAARRGRVGVGAFVAGDGRDARAGPAAAGSREGPKEGAQYFDPSETRGPPTASSSPPTSLMMDEYCMKCHQDIYNDHLHSAHKFSSFNNPAYLFSVRETREGRRWSGTAT